MPPLQNGALATAAERAIVIVSAEVAGFERSVAVRGFNTAVPARDAVTIAAFSLTFVVRFDHTGAGATVTIIRIAIIALFAFLSYTIAARALFARFSGRFTIKARLYVAAIGAAITIICITIVAFFAQGEYSVTASPCGTGGIHGGADPSGFNSAF